MMTRGGVSKALAAVLVVVLLVVVAAVAVIFLFPGTLRTNPTTSSTISTPPNLYALTGQAPEAYCGQATYSNSSLSIDWGNLAPGTEGIQYLCLRNTGTTSITLAVSSSLSSSVGRVTSPQGGTRLNGGGIELVELDLWVSPNVPTGPIPSFSIKIGGT